MRLLLSLSRTLLWGITIAEAPDDEATNLAEEVGRMIAEVPGDRSAKEIGVDDGGDADQNFPS
ncbi:hypothetical protein Acr_18g0011770 [Actinidia rufa]|uniref:Uncharacterized protein n=1 Tax=Actinidia rufa TaxID=165716 RepID=A0A7J0G878_9ERIC|nr:hypothetical protein Acr_18g0011770 [Actinidia rufa]